MSPTTRTEYLIKNNILEIILLVIALLFSIISFIISSSDNHLFSRSGSILILFSVIVEYRLSSKQQKILENTIRSLNGAGYSLNIKIPFYIKIIKTFAHLFILSGTLIWGYGDIFNKRF